MDDIDRTAARIEAEETAIMSALRATPYTLPKGQPGECETCGEWSGRLVKGMCPPCRDRLGVG